MDAKIVVIETSGREGAVGVALGAEFLAGKRLPAEMRHAVGLAPAVRELVRGQGWRAEEIGQVYVSLGPGSFTGLRIAAAFARALAAAVGCRLVGVPSLGVIAENVPPEFAVAVPVLDAKQGQIFAGRYERAVEARGGEDGAGGGGGDWVRTIEAELFDPAELVRAAAARGAGCGGRGGASGGFGGRGGLSSGGDFGWGRGRGRECRGTGQSALAGAGAGGASVGMGAGDAGGVHVAGGTFADLCAVAGGGGSVAEEEREGVRW